LKDDPFIVAWFKVPDEWLIGNRLVDADVISCGIGTVAQRERERERDRERERERVSEWMKEGGGGNLCARLVIIRKKK